MTDLSCDVIMIGAGPAGMMAAIAAASAGAKVAVCDRMDRPGVKLLATGGGRCNITNTAGEAAMLASFGPRGRFIQPALAAMDNEALVAFFASLGVRTKVENGFHVFPASGRACDVQAALWNRCQELGVTGVFGETVTSLFTSPEDKSDGKHGKDVTNGTYDSHPSHTSHDSHAESGVARNIDLHHARASRVLGTVTSRSRMSAPRVILAAGGQSYPQLGSDGSGFELARAAGHTIVPPSPALVPLVTDEKWVATCAGVSLSPARVWIDLPKMPKGGVIGDVLFTHNGLSGPAVLDISGQVAELLTKHPGGVPIRVELTPGTSRPVWTQRLDDWAGGSGTATIRWLLSRHVPASLTERLLIMAGVELDTTAAHVGRPHRTALAELAAALPLTIVATEGFDRAMVMRGGVSLKEVDPHTLASRLVAGLYFAGEVLDLDGPCGGYNLQWAFSSGHLAGRSAARRGA